MDRRLGGLQSQSRRDGEEKNPCLRQESNPSRPVRSLATVLTSCNTSLNAVFRSSEDGRMRVFHQHFIHYPDMSTQPPIQWVPGALSLGEGSGRGVKLTTHLHLVPRWKNEWSYTSTPQYAFRGWCSVKAQGQLYLYLTCLAIETVAHRKYITWLGHQLIMRFQSVESRNTLPAWEKLNQFSSKWK
jgi:hypothetical protein